MVKQQWYAHTVYGVWTMYYGTVSLVEKTKNPTLGSISEAQVDTWENNSARGGGYEFVTMQIEPKA